MDVELALKINKIIHDECKDVPHDIGLRISELVEKHQAEQLILSDVNKSASWKNLLNQTGGKRPKGVVKGYMRH